MSGRVHQQVIWNHSETPNSGQIHQEAEWNCREKNSNSARFHQVVLWNQTEPIKSGQVHQEAVWNWRPTPNSGQVHQKSVWNRRQTPNCGQVHQKSVWNWRQTSNSGWVHYDNLPDGSIMGEAITRREYVPLGDERQEMISTFWHLLQSILGLKKFRVKSHACFISRVKWKFLPIQRQIIDVCC